MYFSDLGRSRDFPHPIEIYRRFFVSALRDMRRGLDLQQRLILQQIRHHNQ